MGVSDALVLGEARLLDTGQESRSSGGRLVTTEYRSFTLNLHNVYILKGLNKLPKHSSNGGISLTNMVIKQSSSEKVSRELKTSSSLWPTPQHTRTMVMRTYV